MPMASTLAGLKRHRDNACGNVCASACPTAAGSSTPLRASDSEFDDELFDKDMFSWAMVCLCNMNRSMTAHERLQEHGYRRVRSFGTGDAVRLPSQLGNGVAAFGFGTAYSTILARMSERQAAWLASAGLRTMLERNARLKSHPESWQAQRDTEALSHDFVCCFDAAVYRSVISDVDARLRKRKVVHTPTKCVVIVLLPTRDTSDDATAAAAVMVQLAGRVSGAIHDSLCVLAMKGMADGESASPARHACDDDAMNAGASADDVIVTPVKTARRCAAQRDETNACTPTELLHCDLDAGSSEFCRGRSIDSEKTELTEPEHLASRFFHADSPLSLGTADADAREPQWRHGMSLNAYREHVVSALVDFQKGFSGRLEFRIVEY